jgi:quercetin dioxygenase-like cupin family protein
MKQLDINKFDDFSSDEISRRILMEDPVMRVVLVSLRAGQTLPEHAANGLVTVYSVGVAFSSMRAPSAATWFRAH